MVVNFTNEEKGEEVSEAVPDKDGLEELLRQNLELTKEIHEMTHKIKAYITFQKVMSFIYLILIVGPIVLSVIYLPSILSSYMGQYQELLDPSIIKDIQTGNIKVPQGFLERLQK